ncbi:MAG: homoserine O-succinyltransferase [Clostridiales Family XIII bacterium]|jgi:homoserine O-succinyltransferase|nr:homoserine O-succinyltransferase [Clostridiales Family XIII bacterium]
MPILVQKGLPAYNILKKENVFVMRKERAERQQIRPIRVAIINLMPIKEITETQLIRMLANTPLQVDLHLLTLATHESTHTDPLHMETFYIKFDEIKNERFDGLIITGAPVETIPFEAVDYWKELTEIMDFSLTNVFSTLHLCWGAQAALYYHFGIEKQIMDKKLFGVFKHTVKDKRSEFTRGFDEEFYVPHSRYTQIRKEDVEKDGRLKILAESKEAGLHMLMTRDKRQLFLQGHSEYDWDTLKLEYERDRLKGDDIDVPVNYFKNDDPSKRVVVKWSGHGNLFFANWLNFVYQETPYDLNDLDKCWKAAGI